MRFLFAYGVLFLIAFSAFPQAENSSFNLTGRAGAATAFAKDYQAIGINPANLGFLSEYQGKKVTIGLLEGGLSFYSAALSTNQLSASLQDAGSTNFTYQQKQDAANAFANKPISFNIDYMLVGASVQFDKIGGFAFNVRDKLQIYANFGQETANLLFMGGSSSYFNTLTYQTPNFPSVTIPNNPPSNGYSPDSLNNIKSGSSSRGKTLSSELDGTKINASWTREFNFSYGKRLYKLDAFEIFGGVGVRYILGYAAVDFNAQNNSFGNSFSSFSPGTGVTLGNSSSPISGGLLTPSGSGYSVDLGTTFKYYGLTAGFSLINLGSMTWFGNMNQPKDTVLQTLNGVGLQNYNLLNQANEFTSDQGPIKWRQSQSITIATPGLFRAGLNYNFKNRLNIGADIIMPLNKVVGSIQSNQYAAGLDFFVLKWLRLSTGFSTGGNTTGKYNVPFGILFVVGMNGLYEFGFATRDITSFISPSSPNLSITSGFLRFRF
jgi:hypothetical protein